MVDGRFMAGVVRAFALVGGLLAGLSCGGSGTGAPLTEPVDEGRADRVAPRYLCDQWRACDCGEAAGVSLSGCDTGIGFAWQAMQEDAAEEGLIFDGACLMRRINAMLERGCEPATQGAIGVGCGPESCSIYYGTVPEGGNCDGGLSSSNCEQGLICLGTCEVPCSGAFAPLGEGDPCVDESGQSLGICVAPLLCDAASRLCAAPPGDGEACVNGACDEGHFCDTTMTPATCRAFVAPGGACTLPQECESLSCDGGSCAPLPGAGEDCVTACAEGLYCIADTTVGTRRCRTLPAEGEACLSDPLFPCAEGLGCDGSVCVEPPGRDEACLPRTTSLSVQCAEGLVCGGRLCSVTPSAPGCDECAEPDGQCVVQVCIPEPAAVCVDNGGLLF